MRVLRTKLPLIAVVLLLTVSFGAQPAPGSAYAIDKGGLVPDKGGLVIVSGTLVAVEGVECPVMIFLNNYHLIGNLQGFGPGDQVTVTGALDMESYCQQGTPLRVISIGSTPVIP